MVYLRNDFSARDTFDCGQCFRWNENKNKNKNKNEYNDGYIGIAGGRICRVYGDTVYCPDKDNAFWENYFAADIDLKEIKSELLRRDPSLADAAEFGGGIRILRQDIWETIISFIISANNNIPRIKKIIEGLCRKFGDKLKPDPVCGITGGEYYSFPSTKKLAGIDVSELAELKMGYRDKYICHAAHMIGRGIIDIDAIPHMPLHDAKTELMRIKGVGPKVADCILLFSCGRYEVFPKDVWIKRIMAQKYNVDMSEKRLDAFAAEKFGDLAGFAQQYLYYYYRENN